jgi:PPOX class probable F420-dependent enzyme
MQDELPFDPGNERYVSLATYRRNGVEVATPVWMAESGGRYYVFSEGKAGKVKRLRHDERVRMAACDYRGRVRGGWLEAIGRVVTDASTVENAYRALRRKYGWQMVVADFFSRLSGRYDRRAIIELEVVA